MASGKRSRGDAPLGLFERVEGFGTTGASGTIVAVSSNTVTVQLDAGALRVVVARVGSGATIVSPAIPAADPAGSAAVMPGPLRTVDEVKGKLAVGPAVDGSVVEEARVHTAGAL
mmetsp:Transcript_913/g.2932  ORF Transcript_913/g.2932 Transcript_913/m.2932 type:complete len:115 (+) Transcript_913:142-486(+)